MPKVKRALILAEIAQMLAIGSAGIKFAGMDIASTPEADIASAAPKAPPVIRRADYRPPAWLVPEIALDFRLALDAPRVTAPFRVQRNPVGDGDDVIRLKGDG